MTKYDRSNNTGPIFVLVRDISLLQDASLLIELIRSAFRLELGVQCHFDQKNKIMQTSLILILNLPDEAHYIGDVTCRYNLKE